MEKDYFKIRFIVAQRRTPQKFFQSDSEKENFIKDKKEQKVPSCISNENFKYNESDINYSSDELKEMKSSDIEGIYTFNIICDEIRTEENIDDPIEFQLQAAPLCYGTSYNSDRENIHITITGAFLNDILLEFNLHE